MTDPTTARAVEELHANASAATGLDDFGDPDYLEGLHVLLDDCRLRGAPELVSSLVGQMSLGALIGRLVAEVGWKQHPEWRSVPVDRPIIIVGMMRTGTTALHRMLSADPALQGAESWLLRSPRPRPPRDKWEKDPAFTAVRDAFDHVYAIDPAFRTLHNLQADLVDECWPLTQQSFQSGVFNIVFPHLENYLTWSSRHDAGSTYARHRDLLKLIFSTSPQRRWILKDPSHTFHAQSLLDIYPDAILVQIHRNPREFLASSCSALTRFRQASGDTVESGFGRRQLALWADAMIDFMDVRARHRPEQFVDIDFGDFVRDPLAAVKPLYERAELSWSPDVERIMRDCLRAEKGNPAHKHTYTLADLGLEEKAVDAAFADYTAAFGLAD